MERILCTAHREQLAPPTYTAADFTSTATQPHLTAAVIAAAAWASLLLLPPPQLPLLKTPPPSPHPAPLLL
jgi:hypothetical protein